MNRKPKLTDKNIKDRGDLKKNLEIGNKPEKGSNNKSFEDRGDSKTLDIVLDLRESPAKKCCTSTTQTPQEFANTRKDERNATAVTLFSDMAGRRKLAERYTIRFKNGASQKPTIEPKHDDTKTEMESKMKKPVLKILSKEESVSLFKAVTFMESGVEEAKKRFTRKPSRSSTKIVRNHKKKPSHKRRRNQTVSPPATTLSPPTEVAKWAPSCLNKYTKPYYEAWVDTTLAAISKDAEKRALWEWDFKKNNFLKPSMTDLVYADVNDERFTGRIKIIV